MTLSQARQQPLTNPLERAGSVRSALVEPSLLCSASIGAAVFKTRNAAALKGFRKVTTNSFQIDFITHTAATTSSMSRITRGGDVMLYSSTSVPLLNMRGKGTSNEPQTALVLQGNAIREVKDTTSTVDTVGVIAVNVLAALAGINASSSIQIMSAIADPSEYRSVVRSDLAAGR